MENQTSLVAVLLCLYLCITVNHASVCTRTAYQQATQQVYYTTSVIQYYYRSCGWFGWRRCLRSRYVSQTRSRYETYQKSVVDTYCCTGYTGTPPNCEPICADSLGNCASCVSPGLCICDPGWKGDDCDTDINECSSHNGGCEYTCANTIGSYTCSCPNGFSSYSHTGCQDIDECASNNGGCDQICSNTPGSYSCSCHPGYTAVGSTCSNINECTAGTDLCTQVCVDTVGSYYCKCNTGYLLAADDYTCNDDPECDTNNGGCEQTCSNTVGSYTCTCNTGYQLASNQHSCDDKNECLTNKGGCSQNCINTHGSFYCTCNDGYALSSNGKGCNDVNECDTNNGGCEHVCTNNVGSYSCSCNSAGYLASGDHCEDINECNSNNGGCSDTCINTIGSYYCKCDTGYSLQSDGRTCSDVNECSSSNGGCGGTCHNTLGGYYCSCSASYVLAGNGKTCNDVNECGSNNGGCGHDCENTVGSYYCECYTGYTLANNGKTCNDNNECNTNNGGCDDNCINTPGSYYCTCDTGYSLDSDQHGCTNINECSQGNGECEHTCTDSPGSFTCTCRTGYELSYSKHCSDINECSSNNGGCDHTCVNTVGSYVCKCNDGYTLDDDDHTCNDINECSTDNGGCEHTCTNTAGSFKCTCNSGYTLDLDDEGCTPVCADACNHCTSCDTPNMCTCDSGWTGNDCCQDINECQTNNGGCAQVCINHDSGHLCQCNSGYTLGSNNKNCIDNNECASDSTNECNQNCTNTAGSYRCYCNTGYELESDETTCVDTNECSSSNGGCNQTCTNKVGSFECSCKTGYTLDSDGLGCTDINECTDGTHECSHHCYNTIGSYTCDCDTGYELGSDDVTCVDIDECSTDNGGCNQTCINIDASFKCSCLQGYILDEDGLGCSDHDECSTNTHACDQHCHNRHSSYYCTCDNGYRLSKTDGRSCIDIDECAEHSSGCNQLCNNTIGGRFCSCYEGFVLSSNNRTCVDINECLTANGGCGHNCTNTIGSYTCSCTTGYELDNDEHDCNDINECTRHIDGCEHICTNTIGSYHCTCNSGYYLEGNDHNCTDVDECQTNNGGCNQTCVNEIASFHCLCQSGYTLNSDGLGCTDINECTEHTDGCGQNCHNTIGSFYCDCDPGYRLNSTNSKTCHDINECLEDTDGCAHQCHNTISSYYCTCYTGYSLDSNNHNCSDINECNTNNGGCNQTCTNNIGSYMCSCNIGYVLANDSHNCNDVNECNNGDSQCEQECINNFGSYTCDCFIGFQLDSNGYNCSDINECNSNNGGCDHNCTNQIGSFECSCLPGYLLEADRLGCMDIDECLIDNGGCSQNCINTNGSYYCTCNNGYRLNTGDNLTCDDINECVEDISGCDQNCTNEIGSYFCSCMIGYYLDSDAHTCNDVNECETNNGDCEHNCHNVIGSYYCSCRDGYDMDPDFHGCTGQPCFENLTAPINGSINCTGSPDQVTDENCTFWCDNGFTFHGSSLRECLSDHTWTGIEPYCVIKHCPTLLPPPNAYIATKPCDTFYTNDCQVNCVDSYYIDGFNSTYYQTCSVNVTNNEVYWSSPPVCELIPSCTSNPCLHNGVCVDVNTVNYRCDCSGTNYKGPLCEVGIVSTPAVPILITRQNSEFLNISAYPETDLRVDIITSSPYLVVNPSEFFFYSTLPNSLFKIKAYKEGIYTISYNLSGSNAHEFETPPPVRVIAVDNVTSFESNPTILTPGCCSPVGLSYQCPYSTNVVHFSSTCSWHTSEDSQYTNGIVFASSNGLKLPLSIGGIHLTNTLTNDIINSLPVAEYSCSDCRSFNTTNCTVNNSTDITSDCQHSQNSSCAYYNFTATYMLNLIASRSLEASYLSYIDKLLPQWLSLYITPFNLSASAYLSFNDFSTILTTGHNIANIEGCQDLVLDSNELYSLIRFNKIIRAQVMDNEHVFEPLKNELFCIAVDLCKGSESPVHINLPKSSQAVIRRFSQVEVLVNEGWELSFQEAMVSRNSKTFEALDISLPENYWNGESFIDLTSLLPAFDIRLKMNAYKRFDNSSSLWSTFNFTGYLYYLTQPGENKIDGVIDGNLYITINTTFENMPAGMTLTTRTNPALFSLFDTLNDTFKGFLMKLDYMPSDSDEFFSTIFKCSDGLKCPSDVHIPLTADRKIDSLLIRNSYSSLSIAGYEFQRGSLEHFLTLSMNDLIQEDVPSLYITSKLTGSQLILNPFLSLRQLSQEEPTVNVSYWRNGKVNAKLSQVTFSILDTAFIAAVSLYKDGSLTFESDIRLINGLYHACITGNTPPGTTWDDFTLKINGTFSTDQGSLIDTLEKYIYNYTNIKVSQTQERISNIQLEINSLEDLMKQLNNSLVEQQSNLTHLNDLLSNAMNNMSLYTSLLNQAQSLYDTANSSVIDTLDSICTYMNCPDMCVPSPYFMSCVNHMTFDEWSTRNITYSKQLLQFKQGMKTDKEWHYEHNCRLITKIRGWGETSFGQTCSYKAVYSNVTYQTGMTYYANVNILGTEAAVTDIHELRINQTCCHKVPCGFEMIDYECALSNTACQLAQLPGYTGLSQAEQALIQPLLQLNQAKLNLSIAKAQLATIVTQINANELQYNQTKTLLQTVQKQHENALNNLILLQNNQAPILSLAEYLEHHSIQQLFNLESISFTATIQDSSPPSLPATFYCTMPFNDVSFTVTTDIHLSTTLPLLQRNLANIIIRNLGMQLAAAGNKRKRSANVIQPSFNKQQFENKCAYLNNVKNVLLQFNNSLQLVLMKSQEAKDNITDIATKLDDIISVDSVNFTHINFTYLQEEFSQVLNNETLLTQAKADPFMTKLTSKITSLHETILSFATSLEPFISWRLSMGQLYNTDITSFANESCFGFTDCLTMTSHVLHELIIDMPKNVIHHDMTLSSHSLAKLSLLQLSLSNNLTLSEAFSRINTIYDLVLLLEQTNYWCSGLPVITQHPNTSIYIEQGNTLTLSCSADSIQDIKYGWSKDGFILPNTNTPVLIINNTTPLDQGQYQCTATNAIGTVSSQLTNVYIVIPPVITLSPIDSTTFEGSDNGGWFACNATGQPMPSYQWYYSSTQPYNTTTWLPVTDSASNELLLQKPKLKQEGWYKCRASIGDIHVFSKPAYLTVYSATFSTLNFPSDFVLYITQPPSDITHYYSNILELKLVSELKNEIQNDAVSIDDLFLLFGYGNTTVQTNATFNSGFNYSLNELISDQAKLALPYKINLIQSIVNFKEMTYYRNFLFHLDESLFSLIGVTLNVRDLEYRCPKGKGVLSGNFICVDCSPGTFPMMVDSSSQCVPCSIGTYGRDRAQNECHPCSGNTSTLNVGATLAEQCIDLCPPGYNSSTGLVPCVECPEFTYALEYGSKTCQLCDTSSGHIPECFIPEPLPSFSSSLIIIDATPTFEEEGGDVTMPIVIFGSILFGLILGILAIVTILTIVITYRRKKKPSAVIQRTRATRGRQPEGEYSVFSNPLFIESRTFERTDSENYDESDEIKRTNPLFMEHDDDEGTEYDSVSSFRPVGAFFPQQPQLEDPHYDEIEPLKFHKDKFDEDKYENDDDDNFDDTLELLDKL